MQITILQTYVIEALQSFLSTKVVELQFPRKKQLCLKTLPKFLCIVFIQEIIYK